MQPHQKYIFFEMFLFTFVVVLPIIFHSVDLSNDRKNLTPYTGRFIMFSVITNIYNNKTKGPNLIEFFTATAKLKKFFLTTRGFRCVYHG